MRWKRLACLVLLLAASWSIPRESKAVAATLIGVSLTVRVDDIGDFWNNGTYIYNYALGTWNTQVTVSIDPATFSSCGNFLAVRDTNLNINLGSMFIFTFYYSDGSKWCYGSEDAYNAGNIRMYNQRSDLGMAAPPTNWYDPGFDDSTWGLAQLESGTSNPYGITSPCTGVFQHGLTPYSGGTSVGQCGCEVVHYRIPFPAVPNAGSVCTAMNLTKTASASTLTCGSTVTFTLAYSNIGAQGATGAVLTDAIPSYITVQSIGNGGVQSGNTITWTLADPYAAGSSGTVSWTGTIQNYVGTITAGQANLTGTNFANRASSGPNLTISCSNPTATPTFTPVPCATENLVGGTLLDNGPDWEGTGFNNWGSTPAEIGVLNSSGGSASNFQAMVWGMADPVTPLAGTIYSVNAEIRWKATNGSKTYHLDVDFNNSDGTTIGLIPPSGATVLSDQKGYGFTATGASGVSTNWQTETLNLMNYKSSWSQTDLKNLALMFHCDGGLMAVDQVIIHVAYVSCPSSASPTNTPTRTRSPTASFSYTASPSFTPTYTATPSRSPSPSYTASQTPSGTPTTSPTMTATRTFSPSPTTSPTPSSTETFSPTPTFSDSPTPSSTPTQSFTFTASPTPTPTATSTPTYTPSPTFSNSPTPTGTPTPTPTYTPTSTNSPTPTWSDSPTLTFSGTPTATFSGTRSFTDSPTVSYSFTPTATYSATPTFSDSPSSTPSLTPSDTYTGTRTFTGSPTPSETYTESYTYTGTATFTDSNTPTDSATESPTFTESETSTETPSVTETRTPTLTRTPSKSPTATKTITLTKTVTRTFSVSPTQTDKTLVFEIKAFYPNPFDDQGVLYYTLAHTAEVELTIYNVAGEPIWRFRETGHQGANTILWKGMNEWAGRVSSGIYVIRLQAVASAGDPGLTRWTTVCVAR